MIGGYNGQPPSPGAPPPQPWGAGYPSGAGYPPGVGYPSGAGYPPGVGYPPGYPPMMAYPPPTAPAPPARPQRPWPQRAVNRWVGVGVVVITLLAVLLAVLAPQAVEGPPATTGLQPLYQSSLTKNDGAWENSSTCQFTPDGLLITAPGAAAVGACSLTRDFPHDVLIKVRLVGTDQRAAVGFLSNYALEIFGSGRFQFSSLSRNGGEEPLVPRGALNVVPIGAGSIALHPSALGTSTRPNDLTILVQGNTYSFYANGQLLTRYTDTFTDSAGPIRLYALGGQALFTNLAIYPAP
jgi:hypothetical protein